MKKMKVGLSIEDFEVVAIGLESVEMECVMLMRCPGLLSYSVL